MAKEVNRIGSDTSEAPVAGQPLVLSCEALMHVSGGDADDSSSTQPAAPPTGMPLQPILPPTWPTW